MVGLLDHNESRPQAADLRAAKSFGGDTHILATQALERADMALLVVAGLRNGGTRRKIVFSIAAATRALDLAARRGVPATVALVQLTPVGRVDLEPGGDVR